MVAIDQMYTRYGLTRISRIKTPVILDLNSLELPYNTTLHLFSVEDLESYATKDTMLLGNNKSILVRTVEDYVGVTQGNFRYKKPIYREFIKTNMKKDKRVRILKETELKVILTRNDTLVYNYGGLSSFHQYMPNPLNPYFSVMNKLTTLVSLVNKDSSLERNFFVNLTVAIPKFNILEMLVTKKMSSALLKRMRSYNYIVFIELWKYMYPEYREESVFNKLTIEASKKLYILFSIGNNGSMVNFFKLISMIKEYDDFDYDIGQLESKQFRKVFYLFLVKIFNSAIVSEQQLINNEEDDTIHEESIDDEIAEDEDETPTALSNKIADELDDDDFGMTLDEITKGDVEDISIDIEYDTLEAIKEEKPIPEKNLVNKINALKEVGSMSKAKATTLSNTVLSQDDMKITVNDKIVTLAEMKKDFDIIVPEKDKAITPTIVATEVGMLNDTITALDKKIIKEQLTPMIVKSMMSIQNSSFVVTDFEIKSNESILGKEDVYEMSVSGLDGGRSKIKVVLPKIEEDGTFNISSNTYVMRKQKSDQPIRKISDSRVALSSHYGKLFIDKASVKRLEISYWVRNKLVKMYSDDIVKNLVLNNGNTLDSVDLPKHYTYFNKYVKSFRYGDYSFNFNYVKRDTITSIDLEVLEELGTVIGTYKDTPLLLTMDNRVLLYDSKKPKEIDDIFSILSLDIKTAPITYATIKIYKSSLPVVVPLAYYVGLTTLLKTYKVKYDILDKSESYDKDTFYSIRFADKKIVIERDYGVNDLLFGGLTAFNKYSKNLYLESFEKRDGFSNIFNMLELSILQINEIKNLEELFIDPMTMSILKEMKEPTNFRGLIVRAIELLTTDYYDHPNDINGVHIKSYDRIPGMLYKELVNSIKDQRNRSVFGKSKLVFNPYSVISKISEDSTTVQMADLNPIAALKQLEDVTSLGQGGRSKESMSKETRILHPSEVGIMSEGGKDSGDIGISGYTSANPKIKNTLGLPGEFDIKKDGWSSVLSTSAMIAPFGISDDVKRLVFSNVQNSHVIATKNMSIPYVRTGYESVLASRVNDKFAVVAEDYGVVKDVTKKSVTVEYTIDNKTFKKDYKLYSWYSKEESNASFKHTLIPNVTKGTKVYKDYVLVYDESFFSPDPYDRSRVVYRQGNTARVAFVENIESFEDSIAISNSLGELMTTVSIKSKSNTITSQQTLDHVINIGDKVEHSTSLYTITDKDFNSKGLDDKTIEIIQSIKSASPKANVRGIVEDIRITYNVDLEDLDDNLKYHIERSDKRLLESTGYTGKVGHGYSIKGRPLLEGELEIKVLIKVDDGMGIGDKAIVGNQLKCTVGDILEDTRDSAGKPVDMIFSTKSLSNRIVLSPIKIGLLTTYMKTVTDKACDMYFS